MPDQQTGPHRMRRAERFAQARAEEERANQRTWQVTPGYEQALPPQPETQQNPLRFPQSGVSAPLNQPQTGFNPAGPMQGSGFHQANQPQRNGYSPAGQPQGNGFQQAGRFQQANGYQAQYAPPVYQPVKPEENRELPTEKEERGKRARHAILMALLVTAILVAAVVGGYTGWQLWKDHQHRQQVTAAIAPYGDRYLDGVYVDGIHLGGMTQEEAWQTVSENANSLHTSWFVALTYQGQTVREITSADLNMTVDVESTMRQAWAIGHTGDEEQRYQDVLQTAGTPVRLFTTAPAADTAQLDSILTVLKNQMYVEARDAQFLSFNAQLTNPFTFLPEVTGLVLDTDSLKQQLYEMVSSSQSGNIELVPREIQPNVTVAQLTAQFATLRGSASTPITSGSTENRNNNIRRAFELISGTRIDPGKEFSFNRIVGERTLANGFYEADEYVYNAVQSGVGGGVCQASSTVYMAAVRAGLEIVKREPHSMAVRYTDYGKDATVYWYSNHKIDLVFRNNTDQPIYLKAAVESDAKNRSKSVCKVYIYGASLGNVTYDIVTEETPIDPPEEPEYKRDKKGEYVTYTDQQKVVQEAAKGAMVDSWRVMYLDGIEVSREKLDTDEYKAKPQIIYVGTKSRP